MNLYLVTAKTILHNGSQISNPTEYYVYTKDIQEASEKSREKFLAYISTLASGEIKEGDYTFEPTEVKFLANENRVVI